ncbi:hypothetical protein RCL_jg22211.t1 [Rhizophagus clarus]|uniref:Uncharacterized protein n=1 Tax=Rhizophagus clarus TaxID=94130 RepID=A0A8H3LJJ2_9GLOM|nr:hypothetical protein RCL_jg22211.t1 [Rhizophagus clarus]
MIGKDINTYNFPDNISNTVYPLNSGKSVLASGQTCMYPLYFTKYLGYSRILPGKCHRSHTSIIINCAVNERKHA